jgi:cyclophilin family peptidyl-prolyl cis-trans isomerase
MKRLLLVLGVACLLAVFRASAQTPVITAEPQSVIVNNASAAAFTVAASNAVSYQWFFQGTNSLSGETNATLSLDDVSTNQAGSYTVVMTSSNLMSVTSAPPAVLTIVPGTIIQWIISTYPGGGSSNFLVQLFDHDKPATVENFIHYITAGSYSNMFFDRDVTNFVLQGGDYVSVDRTTNGLNVNAVSTGTNLFPSQLENEFGVGPLIHNHFGTLAMALQPGKTNSASSAFFFNLVDNSAILDAQDFTVFGRILSGTNILQYFNTLGGPSNGIYPYNPQFTNLPVNYNGTNAPTDANLFYCGFAFISPTNPPVITNPPMVSITFPAPNAVLANVSDVTFTGTASDNVGGIAEVYCVINGLAGVYEGQSFTNVAVGATNWLLPLTGFDPGIYEVSAYAQDGAGNLSAPATVYFTNLAPLVLVSQPSNLTVNAGSSALFAIEAGNAATYQWFFQGTNILTGETNATLGLDDLSTNQAGSYTVEVTSSDTISMASATAVLTVVQGTIIQWTISKYANGSSSNFLVELFDHDKPATVANFIHYIGSGAYSNTFFDTVASTVLVGGDFATADRTTNYLDVRNLSMGTNIFPSQLASEFDVGPFVHNTYGTLAALGSFDAGESTSGFFFNLEDNSTNANFEGPSAGFTVFGRILSGANILQYFTNLSAPSNGIYDYTNSNTNFDFPSLPVNYDGTNKPADASVFYCDFRFISPTNPPGYTNLPTVSITFPAPNQVFTNGGDLTVAGMASAAVGVAEVFCVLTSSTGAYGNTNQILIAQGTTNWSLDLGIIEAGVYQLTAYAQDGAGNLSAPVTEYFTNLAILTIVTNSNGLLTTNAPLYLVPGQTNTVKAMAGPGQLFYNWTVNGVASLNQTQTFTSISVNFNLVVTYLPATASAGLTIASPVSGAKALSIQNVLTISGAIASTNFTNLTCQFFYNSNSLSAALPATITGTNWSLTVTNYANGSNYTVVALATNAAGQASFASAGFSLVNVEILTLKTNGAGTIINTNPLPYLAPGTYTVKAAPAKGYSFYGWNNGVTTTLNPINTFQIVSNLTLTATFIPEDTSLTGLKFTYPSANAMLTNGTFSVEGTLPASLAVTQLTCQLFLQSNGLTALPQPVTNDPAATKWTFPVTNLTPGQYTILAVGYDNQGHSRLVSENFNLLSKLVVNVQGEGSVTSGLNGKYLQVGKSYNITATPKKGQLFAFWGGTVANSNSAATKFVMSTNTVLTANFASNLFPSVAGTYTGLFLDPASVSPSNAGFIKVTITSTGAFSGDLTFPSVTYPIYSDQFLYNGSGLLEGRNAFNTNDLLVLVFSLDLTNGTDTITGYVADETTAGLINWASELVLYRAVTRISGSNAPAAGKYVLLVQPEDASNAPVATGYEAISLTANGALSLVGVLSDNTAISQSAKMSKDGIWPVYIVPSSYKGKGMIIGWQTNTLAGACDGQLFWCKPGPGSASNLTSSGAVFAGPAANTQYQMILAGGTSNSLPVNSSRQFEPQLNVVAITLQSGGILSGNIDVGGEKLPFKGAFIDPANGGAGFIIDKSGQTQGFQIIYGNN